MMRRTATTPVDIELDVLLGDIPRRPLSTAHSNGPSKPVLLPRGITVNDALQRCCDLVSVGSKRFLTNKVDRAVTGLIAQQQCCGPLQLTVADVAVVAQSHFGTTGIGNRHRRAVDQDAASTRLPGPGWRSARP